MDCTIEASQLFLKNSVEPGYAIAERILQVEDSVSLMNSAAVHQCDFRLRPLRTATKKSGPITRIPGPADLIDEKLEHRLTVILGRTVKRMNIRSGRAVAVFAHNVFTNEMEKYQADRFVIAADAIRSPEILYASGLLPEPGFPIGRFVTDHPIAVARVNADTDLGNTFKEIVSHQQGKQFCRGVVLEDAPYGALRLIMDTPCKSPQDRTLALFWYGVGHPKENNRIEYKREWLNGGYIVTNTKVRISEDMCDPKELDVLVEDMKVVASELGAFQRGWSPRLLPIGSAAHAFGTLRTAIHSADASVTEWDGKVKGLSNVYVVGPSRIPVPSAFNPALTSIAAAVVTSYSI